MVDSFEDHCWQDIVPADVLEIYKHYRRDTTIGPAPALLAIDLYDLAYEGGAKPVSELVGTYPSSCGINAYTAISPTQKLFAAARAAGLPVFYTTMDTRPTSRPGKVSATNRRKVRIDDAAYNIRAEFDPEPGDVVITKQRASAFYGTPLSAHMLQLGVRSVIVCGESTSGCVRASSVDAYSLGFHVSVIEECVFDRSELSHKVNLFDLHHKYADVLHIDQALAEIGALAQNKAA
jgi:nicotinamidase-related amidase